MERTFKEGNYVLHETDVCTIVKIDNEVAYLSNGLRIKISDIKPIAFYSGYDAGIMISFSIPVRASIVGIGNVGPRRNFLKPYLKANIHGKTITSIIDEEGLRYLHQLQNWVNIHGKDYKFHLLGSNSYQTTTFV